MSSNNDTVRTPPSTTHRRRRTAAVIAVAAAALGSFAVFTGSDADTTDTTEIAFGSTWS